MFIKSWKRKKENKENKENKKQGKQALGDLFCGTQQKNCESGYTSENKILRTP